MKSKKILAMVVAFASFMAVATSGLAAVDTTTTYNTASGKVEVEVDVTGATAGSEVTYLVKSNDAIVYIDQQTADGTGAVSFDYKIAKDKIVNLATDVQFGTNGEAAIEGAAALALANINVTAGENATIAFYADAACETLIGDAAIVGNKDEIYAKIVVAEGFAIDTVTGLAETATANVYKVIANDVAFTTKATYVEPEIQEPEQEELKEIITEDAVSSDGSESGEAIEVTKVTKVLKVVGQPTEVGVEYNGYKFPALTNGGAYESGKLYAVRIIVKKGVVIDTLPTYMNK